MQEKEDIQISIDNNLSEVCEYFEPTELEQDTIKM